MDLLTEEMMDRLARESVTSELVKKLKNCSTGGTYFPPKEMVIPTGKCQPLAPDIIEMSHAGLYKSVQEMLGEVDAMFKKKNAQYGASGDALYNFRAGARMAGGSGTAQEMLSELLGYARKHLVTIQNKGLADPDLKERCIDVVVYYMIAAIIADVYATKKKLLGGAKGDGPCTRLDV